MAQENGITFIEINSKEYVRVEAAFKKITESILNKAESGKLPLNQVLYHLLRESESRQETNQTPKF